MTALVKHLHAFVREVDLTEAEWADAVQFLMETGKCSTPQRNEFILLSDTLGVSMLTVSLAQARKSATLKGATEATEATVEGPFYWQGAPDVPLGANLAEEAPRRARAVLRPSDRHRGQAARGRAARRLVGRRRGPLRRAGERSAEDARPRPAAHRRRGALLLLVDQAFRLSDPGRCDDRHDAAEAGPAELAAGAHSRDGVGATAMCR